MLKLENKLAVLVLLVSMLLLAQFGQSDISHNSELSALRLLGICIYKNEMTALIKDNKLGTQTFYNEGDMVSIYLVEKIESNRVMLNYYGAKFYIYLFDSPGNFVSSIADKKNSTPETFDVKHPRTIKKSYAPSQEPQFCVPVGGEIKSGFGFRQHPMGGARHFHSGVDIAAPHGHNVRSCSDGVVIYAATKGGLGKAVIIRHNNKWSSVYGHLSKIMVRKGEKVNIGQSIGRIGSTGISTGPHLHFELRKYGRAVDPEIYLSFNK